MSSADRLAIQIDEPRQFDLAQIWIASDQLAGFLERPRGWRLRLFERKCFRTEILKHCARPLERERAELRTSGAADDRQRASPKFLIFPRPSAARGNHPGLRPGVVPCCCRGAIVIGLGMLLIWWPNADIQTPSGRSLRSHVGLVGRNVVRQARCARPRHVNDIGADARNRSSKSTPSRSREQAASPATPSAAARPAR